MYSNTTDAQGGQKVSIHLMITAQKTRKNILNNSSHFEDGHHRIHLECGPCYTEAFEDGPDRGFRNVGQYKTDAGETPKS
jgi:hypothetical protein